MKYKVGDKFRMVDGGIASVEGARCDVYKVIDDGGVNYVTNAYISHLVISEITDELIDRLKNEKIAWHFKSNEDYVKVLKMLEDKGMDFNRYFSHPELLFANDMEDFAIRYSSCSLTYDDYSYLKERGYEIIEIMKPVYVPKKLVIDQVNGDIKVHGYSLKIINDIFYADGLRLEYQDGKLCYKGIDCEVLFQQYMQQKKIPDLEKKVENQRKEVMKSSR